MFIKNITFVFIGSAWQIDFYYSVKFIINVFPNKVFCFDQLPNNNIYKFNTKITEAASSDLYQWQYLCSGRAAAPNPHRSQTQSPVWTS